MKEEAAYLADAFRRVIAGTVTPQAIRIAERSLNREPIWSALAASGFLDALVPEEAGGAGITQDQAFPLILALGEHAVPVPFAETMVARGLLAAGAVQAPEEAAIILAAGSAVQPCAAFADHALVQVEDRLLLTKIEPGGDDIFRLGGTLGIRRGEVLAAIPAEPGILLRAAAAVSAAQMAGAMARMLEMTLRYAGERKQFGKPLGKFQAIQQQLAVMAEQVISAQVAARSAFCGTQFDQARVAAAKCRTNEAAELVCAIAHAVHGAIGVTEEFDLQLYSRRLKQWQLAYGSASFWGEELGRIRVAAASVTSADFIRSHLAYQEQVRQFPKGR